MAAPNTRGTGSVFYNKTRNKWMASYYVPNIETGKPKKIRKSFDTQEEARKYLIDISYQKDNSIFIENNSIPLAKLMKVLIKKKLDSNLITERAYARTIDTIRIIEKSYLGELNINAVATEQVQDFLNTLTTNYSNSSIQKVYFQFKKAFEYSLNKGYIHQNPMLDVVKPKSKKEDKVLESLELDEQQRLTDYLLTTTPYLTRYKNVFLLQMYMGLRVGEALALKSTDFNFEKRILSVSRTLTTDKNDKICVGSSTKTMAGKRNLPIPEFLLPYILEQIEISQSHDNGLLFTTLDGGLVNHSTINAQLKKIAKIIGIEKHMSTHILRHTYGTRCIESGMRAVALQRLLGHTDISVTLNTYTSILDKYKEAEMEKVNNYYINNQIFNAEISLLDSKKVLNSYVVEHNDNEETKDLSNDELEK